MPLTATRRERSKRHRSVASRSLTTKASYRVRVAAVAALGDTTGAQKEVNAAIDTVGECDGLLGDRKPATRSRIEAVMQSRVT